jgi:hypothetical protein
MKMHLLAGLTALTLVALGVPDALAHQRHRGLHGCPGCACDAAVQGETQRNSAPDRYYDADAVTTLRGTVTAVTVVPARGGRAGGSHLALESDGKVIDVHLGPSWFLDRQGLALAKGDSVEVTGSLVEQNGTTFLIARELKKGAKVVTLRDERGVPAWSGGARR